jgi:hypothetical protein
MTNQLESPTHEGGRGQSCVGWAHRVVIHHIQVGLDACSLGQALGDIGMPASATCRPLQPAPNGRGVASLSGGPNTIFAVVCVVCLCSNSPACLCAWLFHTFLRKPLVAHDSCQATAWQLPSHLHVWGSLVVGKGEVAPPPPLCGTLSGEGEIIAFCISFALEFVVDCCTFWLPNLWEVV